MRYRRIRPCVFSSRRGYWNYWSYRLYLDSQLLKSLILISYWQKCWKLLTRATEFSASIAAEVTAFENNGSYYFSRNCEDYIVTPFAQILASLRNVRSNYINLTNLPSKYVIMVSNFIIWFSNHQEQKWKNSISGVGHLQRVKHKSTEAYFRLGKD